MLKTKPIRKSTSFFRDLSRHRDLPCLAQSQEQQQQQPSPLQFSLTTQEQLQEVEDAPLTSYHLQQEHYTIDDFIQNLQAEYYEYYRLQHSDQELTSSCRYSDRKALDRLNSQYQLKVSGLGEDSLSVRVGGECVVRFGTRQEVRYFGAQSAACSWGERVFEELEDEQDLSEDDDLVSGDS